MVALLGSARRAAADHRGRARPPTSTSAATRSPITGQPADNAFAVRLFDELHRAARHRPDAAAPTRCAASSGCCAAGGAERPADVLSLNILSRRGRTIRPKTLNQKRYVDAIDQHTIVFGIGPAGTGKTYLAMAKAVQALQAKQVNRIILTRPAVEAGERLGFLPGTLSDKIDPYLRPLYDALHDMVDPESIPRLMAGRDDRGRAAGLHARPHAERRVHHPRRGAEHHRRADEDVPHPARVRLEDRRHRRRHPGRPARRRSRAGCGSCGRSSTASTTSTSPTLTSTDVVRHRLVGDIVDAYERWDASRQAATPPVRRSAGAHPAATPVRGAEP